MRACLSSSSRLRFSSSFFFFIFCLGVSPSRGSMAENVGFEIYDLFFPFNTPCTFDITSGIVNISPTVGLFYESFVINTLTTSYRLLLYYFGIGSIFPDTILYTNPNKLSAANACYNVHNSYRTHPSAHTSLLKEYGLFSQTSGLM